MRAAIGTIIILFLSFLFAATPTVAQTSTSSSSSSTVTNTTDNTSGNEINNNANSTAKTTVTNSTTTTTVDNGDARIVDMIYKKYAKDSVMNGTTLTVTCKNGVVNISGNVTATSQAEEAISVAKSIEGVKEVSSSINVVTNQTRTNQPESPHY